MNNVIIIILKIELVRDRKDEEGEIENSTCKSHMSHTHWATSTWSCPSNQGHPLGPHTPLSHGFVSIQIQRSQIHSQKPSRSEPWDCGPRLSLSMAVFVSLMPPPTGTTCFLVSFMWQTVTSVIELRPCRIGPTPTPPKRCLVTVWLASEEARVTDRPVVG